MGTNDQKITVQRQYIGARYVPKFFQGPDGTPAWIGNVPYEPLTIVTYLGNSYTSKIPVTPGIGNPANNPTYWALTGSYNAQVSQYQQQVEEYKQIANQTATALETETTNREVADNVLTQNIDSLNQRVTTLETKEPRFILFVGDSYADKTRYPANSWCDYTAQYMGLTENDYVVSALGSTGFVYAAGGVTTFLTLLNNAVIPEGKKVTDVVVCGGLNDGVGSISTNEIKQAIKTFVYTAKQKFPDCTVWLGFIGFEDSVETTPAITNAMMAYYTCGENGAKWIKNSQNAMKKTGSLGSDGVHPTQTGQMNIAQIISNYLMGIEENFYFVISNNNVSEYVLNDITKIVLSTLTQNNISLSNANWTKIGKTTISIGNPNTYLFTWANIRVGTTFTSYPLQIRINGFNIEASLLNETSIENINTISGQASEIKFNNMVITV